jgi:hypothetical protein
MPARIKGITSASGGFSHLAHQKKCQCGKDKSDVRYKQEHYSQEAFVSLDMMVKICGIE